MKNVIYRPVIATGMLLGLLLLLALTALGGVTLRNLQRINTIEDYLDHSNRLLDVGSMLDRLLLQSPSDPSRIGPEYADLRRRILELAQYKGLPGDPSAMQLQKLRELFATPRSMSPARLSQAREVIGRLQDGRIETESMLLDNVKYDTKLEFSVAVGAPFLAIGMILLLGRYTLRRHILNPLEGLNKLIARLVGGEFSPVDTERIDSVLLPLFRNYNRLIGRLAELEDEHRSHTQSLEQEVRAAARALLEQSRSLSRAERLAAVGELAASTAHELRNPLAGIQVALDNIRLECNDPELCERLGLIRAELGRLTQSLNGLLASSRHTPEAPKKCELSKLVVDLFTLLRYQIDDDIVLRSKIAPDLVPFLPENELRQALLNLTLNATQALEGQGGTVTVSAILENDALLLNVCDDGPGFPPELLRSGIRPFATYRDDGTGLGLVMVQRFAQSLGGTLTLKNHCPDTCATLNLPIPGRHA